MVRSTKHNVTWNSSSNILPLFVGVALFPKIISAYGLEPPRHLHIFTKEALLSAAKQAGFSKIKVITSNFSAAGVFLASARLKTNHENSLPLRLILNFSRLALTFYGRFYPDSGEELILIAEK